MLSQFILIFQAPDEFNAWSLTSKLTAIIPSSLVEIPTRYSFVTEFIIPKFLKVQHILSGTPLIIRTSKLYLQPLVYIQIW
jgi:hypothetical protein